MYIYHTGNILKAVHIYHVYEFILYKKFYIVLIKTPVEKSSAIYLYNLYESSSYKQFKYCIYTYLLFLRTLKSLIDLFM